MSMRKLGLLTAALLCGGTASVLAACPYKNEVPLKSLTAGFEAWKSVTSAMAECGNFKPAPRGFVKQNLRRVCGGQIQRDKLRVNLVLCGQFFAQSRKFRRRTRDQQHILAPRRVLPRKLFANAARRAGNQGCFHSITFKGNILRVCIKLCGGNSAQVSHLITRP